LRGQACIGQGTLSQEVAAVLLGEVYHLQDCAVWCGVPFWACAKLAAALIFVAVTVTCAEDWQVWLMAAKFGVQPLSCIRLQLSFGLAHV